MTNEERMVRALDKIAVSLDGINKTLKIISKNKEYKANYSTELRKTIFSVLCNDIAKREQDDKEEIFFIITIVLIMIFGSIILLWWIS